MPGWKPKARGGKAGVNPVSAGIGVDFPDIIQVEPSLARPSILVSGCSGTGKTWGAAQLLAAGKKALVISVESKMQTLMAYNPQVIFIGSPVENKATGGRRPPTASEMYQRLQIFRERLGAGEFREHKGEVFDLLIIDGMMEVGAVIHRHFRDNTPISKGGEKNTYAMADAIGIETVDFVKGCRDAASAASALFGIPPIGVYTTCGEFAKEPKLGGDVRYKPALYGNVGPDNIPFAFEAVIHLEVDRDDDGRPRYIAHTVTNEPIFFAKAPAHLPPYIVDWNMNDIYNKIIEGYKEGIVPKENQDEE